MLIAVFITDMVILHKYVKIIIIVIIILIIIIIIKIIIIIFGNVSNVRMSFNVFKLYYRHTSAR